MEKPVYIDIGTFDGVEMKWAIENGYEVHSFEPNPAMKPYLEPYKDKVVINYVAAWNEDGIKRLYTKAEGDNSDQGVSLIKEKTNVSKEKYIEVPTINIGRYLKELNRDIDILKIDAEGADYYIIESILDNFDVNRIREWRVEDHFERIDSDEWQKHRQKVRKRLKKLNIETEKWR